MDSKYFAAAESELTAVKLRNERENAQRRTEVFSKHPEIEEMDKELSATSGKLIDLIIGGGADISEKLRALEKENLMLQERIKNELLKNGYSADYLDMPYSCPLCRDTGTVGGRRCSCYMDMARRAAMRELNESSPLSLCSFDDIKLEYCDDKTLTPVGLTARQLMKANLDFCKRYAEDFHLPCGGILMQGQTGLGKTHLSLSIAAAVLKKGYSAIYGSAPELLRRIEKEHFGSGGGTDTLDALQRTELLVLDDVGAEFESRFYASALYNLLNNRVNSALPTIVSTNLTLRELKERYGDRITSRLMVMEQLSFFGNDVRIVKSLQKA